MAQADMILLDLAFRVC